MWAGTWNFVGLNFDRRVLAASSAHNAICPPRAAISREAPRHRGRCAASAALLCEGQLKARRRALHLDWCALAHGLWIAGRTGLEPAASGVTGRRYNQLNYRPSVEAQGVASPPPHVNIVLTNLSGRSTTRFARIGLSPTPPGMRPPSTFARSPPPQPHGMARRSSKACVSAAPGYQSVGSPEAWYDRVASGLNISYPDNEA